MNSVKLFVALVVSLFRLHYFLLMLASFCRFSPDQLLVLLTISCGQPISLQLPSGRKIVNAEGDFGGGVAIGSHSATCPSCRGRGCGS